MVAFASSRAWVSSPAWSASAPQQRGSRGTWTSKPSAASTRAVASFTCAKNTLCTQPWSSATVPRRSPRASKRSGSRPSERAKRRVRGHRRHRSEPRCQPPDARTPRQPGEAEPLRQQPRAGASARSRAGWVNSSKIRRRWARSPRRALEVPLDLRAGVLDQLVVLHARRAGGDARHAAEAAVEMGHERRRDLLVPLLHQHDPPARRVHLLAPEHVGRAGGQAEAAVDAVGDQVELGRSRRVVAAHTHTPAGSKRSFTRCISARVAGSIGPTGSSSSSAGLSSSRDDEVAPQALDRVRRGLLEPQPPEAERRAADHRRPELVGRAQQLRQPGGEGGHLQHAAARAGPRAARPRAGRRPRSRSRVPRRAAAARPPRPAGAAWRRRSAPARCRCRRSSGCRAHGARAGSEPAPRRRAASSSASAAMAHGGGGRGGDRVEAHGQLDDRAERPERAGEQLRDVVAGHVLDDLAAALRERAVRERDPHAHDEVTRAAVATAERAGVAAATTPPTVAPPSGGSSASI